MKTLTYSESRARYAEVLQSVEDDREEVLVTRGGKPAAVIVNAADWASMQETMYLKSSPANYRQLLEAMARVEAGEDVEHELLEVEDE